MTIFFEMLDISRDNYLMFEDLILRLKQLGRFDDVQDEKRLDFLRKKEHFHSNFLNYLISALEKKLSDFSLKQIEIEKKIMGSEEK